MIVREQKGVFILRCSEDVKKFTTDLSLSSENWVLEHIYGILGLTWNYPAKNMTVFAGVMQNIA